MTDRTRTIPTFADMAEATRLTQAGRLQEATALLQRGLFRDDTDAAGRSGPAEPHTIDLVATRIEPSGSPHATGPSEIPHAAIIPDRVREAVGQVVRGFGRGVAPVLKGFGKSGTHGPASRGPEPDDGQFVEGRFTGAAGAREYRLFVPSPRAGRRPLLVMLHGCSQTPEDFAAGTRMNALAEIEGVYVVYPRQTSAANGQKCWNWFQPGDQGREMGEAGIIAGITRAVIAEHAIDPSQVYIAGLSAGGAAAANIARAYPDLYAAVGVHSGLAAGCARDVSSAMMAMHSGAPGAASPGGRAGFGGGSAADAVRMPTIVIHGAADPTVSPRNGDAVLAQAGIDALTPLRETGGTGAGHAYTRTRYQDAAGSTQVEAWIVKGAGHAWAGGSPAGSFTDPRGPDASRAMLDFFLSHRLGGRASS